MIDFIIDNCSYINYKYLFITPTNHNLLNDDYIIISSGCEEYIGSKCSKENLTNEVDDCLTLMVYDYIKYHKMKIVVYYHKITMIFHLLHKIFLFLLKDLSLI